MIGLGLCFLLPLGFNSWLAGLLVFMVLVCVTTSLIMLCVGLCFLVVYLVVILFWVWGALLGFYGSLFAGSLSGIYFDVMSACF